MNLLFSNIFSQETVKHGCLSSIKFSSIVMLLLFKSISGIHQCGKITENSMSLKLLKIYYHHRSYI